MILISRTNYRMNNRKQNIHISGIKLIQAYLHTSWPRYEQYSEIVGTYSHLNLYRSYLGQNICPQISQWRSV